MAQTIEDYEDSLQIRIKDYGKSLRRLLVASVIIGAAIWYSDYSEAVNVADAPVELQHPTPGAVGSDGKVNTPDTNAIPATTESS